MGTVRCGYPDTRGKGGATAAFKVVTVFQVDLPRSTERWCNQHFAVGLLKQGINPFGTGQVLELAGQGFKFGSSESDVASDSSKISCISAASPVPNWSD